MSTNTYINTINKIRKALITSPSLGSIVIGVKISESHNMSTELTENVMEDGTIVNDHAILKPRSISINVIETNTGAVRSPRDFFEMIEDVWEKRELLTITTEHKIYSNMILVEAPMLHAAPYRGSLQVTLNLTQANFQKFETFQFQNASDVGNLNKSLSETVDAGMQSLDDNSSFLTSFF